jgi:hypothetical protein
MPVRLSTAFAAAAVALGLAAPAHAGGPGLTVGVVEDAVRAPTVMQAKEGLMLLRLAGFDAVRLTQTWTLGEARPPAWQLAQIRNVLAAGRLMDVHVEVAVFPSGSSQTPQTSRAQAQFAAFAARVARSTGVREMVVGNEPNLNRWWLPQFTANGGDAAAPSFLRLLARTYDALKRVDPHIVVDGVGVSPRGGDRTGGARPTHSPTRFIADLGKAYRASKRTRPVMDSFDIHPYELDSKVSPTTAHPRSTTIAIADYGKLVEALHKAFAGTKQPSSTLPIVYGEFGVETTIPRSKADLYTGTEPATTHPVSPATQGRYYREAIALAFCQPRVRALYLLHAFDEPSRAGWQSGVYYVDQTPKPSLPIVRQAIAEARRGVLAHCPALHLTPAATRISWPSAGTPLHLGLTCSIDCTYTARLESLASGRSVVAARGRLTGGVNGEVALRRPSAAGRYRLLVALRAPVNPGRPRLLTSRPFTLGGGGA